MCGITNIKSMFCKITLTSWYCNAINGNARPGFRQNQIVNGTNVFTAPSVVFYEPPDIFWNNVPVFVSLSYLPMTNGLGLSNETTIHPMTCMFINTLTT